MGSRGGAQPSDKAGRRTFSPVGFSLALTGLIAWPWLSPGFLFGTDWPAPRHFDLPVQVSSSAPVQLLLWALGWVVGGEATGKVLVVGVIFGAAIAAFQAVPESGFWPRAAGASIYVLNPFVYGRLHYGQLYLLAAYAVLPWVLMATRRLLAEPSLRHGLVVGFAMAMVGMFSPHVFLMAGLVVTLVAPFHVLWTRPGRAAAIALAGAVGAAVASAGLFSSYWIVPLLAGRSYEAGVIAGTGGGEIRDYAAVADPSLGLLPNLVGLYGFWAERTGRFESMKDFVPLWPVVLGLILLLAAAGAVVAFRGRRSELRALVAGLLLTGAIAVVLEMGVSSPATSGIVTWLDAHLAIYRGLRDAGKWAVVLALVYSQLGGLGIAALLDRVDQIGLRPVAREWVGGLVAAVLIAVPVYYGNGLLFGAHGGIVPSPYPGGWYAADRFLASDPGHGSVLFLPWHEYMGYSFVRNENKVVAPLAPTFFTVPMLTSADPELPGVAPPATQIQSAVDALVAEGPKADWAGVLASLGVKYIVLAREADWTSFAYLDGQPGMAKVADYGEMLIYRNQFVVGSHD